jgi:hypothetical protein
MVCCEKKVVYANKCERVVLFIVVAVQSHTFFRLGSFFFNERNQAQT